MQKIKWSAKCPHCGFNNSIEVKEGFIPKWCASCSKEIEYKETGANTAPVK